MNNNAIITFFTKHRVSSSLIMLIMLISGLWSLTKMNVQLFPKFKINIITITVVWPGGNAKDVEHSITKPLELELKSLDHIKEMKSTSKQNLAVISLELEPATDTIEMLSKVRERVSAVKQLPPDIENPIIKEIEHDEPIARLLLSGPDNIEELKDTVYQVERELLDRGVTKTVIQGLPKKEILIEIGANKLKNIKLSLPEIANIIRAKSKDASIGMFGDNEFGNTIRSTNQKRTINEFANLALLTDENGQLLKLGDIANITIKNTSDQPLLYFNGKPAIEITSLRAEDANTLTSAKILNQWIEERKPEFGKSINITTYFELWHFLKERLQVLINNGIGGLILILIFLFIFLDRNIAFWVAMGIPTSFMATLYALHLLGGSINMISLFALIMTLGIIVDDTVVISEQTLTNLNKQKNLPAVTDAARKMFAPIMAASLTTVAAFIPLLLITNMIGQALREIPIVIACFICASLLECFFVLPGHLYHSFQRQPSNAKSKFRVYIQEHTANFIQTKFKPLAKITLAHPLFTIMSVLAILLFALGLVLGNHLPFNLFPSPDSKWLAADVQFHSGTPEKDRDKFLHHLHDTMQQTMQELSGKNKRLVRVAVINKNTSSNFDQHNVNSGPNYSSIVLELLSPDKRKATNDQITKKWLSKTKLTPNIQNLSISTPDSGPPGKDIDIQIVSDNYKALQKAADTIALRLKEFNGVYNIYNDTSTQQQEIRYNLTPQAKTMKITEQEVNSQMRAAISGEIVQIFHEPNEEVEVKVIAPENERKHFSMLDNYPFITKAREAIPFQSIIELEKTTVPDHYLHINNQLSTSVTAKLDKSITTTTAILNELDQDTIPQLTKKLGVKFNYKGKAQDQRETIHDMVTGMILGVAMIYIILAWVFSSYISPLLVMSAIPLGLAGAIIGHLIMGIDLTILSLFGLFGVSGIVINDSIILINEYDRLKLKMPKKEALIEAACRRFRPVVLTSVTTIAGLTPLLFETSLQAQFLIPMATSLAFGLGFATILILIFIPCLMIVLEQIKDYSKTSKETLIPKS